MSAVLSLAGCATVQQTYDSWFGNAPPTPGATSKTKVSSGTEDVYYADSDGLKVYDEPSSSSKVVGTLARHQKVVRTKLDRGYAHVRTSEGKLEGWVVNARLIWRLPRESEKQAEPAAEAATEESGAAEPEAAGTPEEAPAGEEPTPTRAPEQAAPARGVPPTPTAATGAAPSIFDAY